MLETNKVYNCDCIDLMRAMKQQGIVADWLIADPPYGINIGHTGFYKAVPTKNMVRQRQCNATMSGLQSGTMHGCQKNTLT